MSVTVPDLSVLLIEPSHTQSKILQGVLDAEGITNQETCCTGTEALEYIQKYSPDLVISAMYFDDMTAIELLQRIRKADSNQDLNFMLVSSETSFSMIDPIKQAGVIAILPKPFDQRDFHNALSAARDTLEVNDIPLENYDVDELVALIVDDSSTARKHIAKLLNNCGIESILFADNGQAAIDVLHNEKVDFVITDYNMPEMDGEALVQYIQSSDFSYLPILMVSSESDSPRLSALRQAGVCAMLDKATDPKSFRETLSRSLNN
ncbi:response regulator [Bermanella marisrubri]|uniref:Chemotaxis protein CheY (2 CheY domains) n=1 Tax=Bermanella marisrubri TaxID=207949 RepID=Q1N180_9GAMM|nr:response regulator [Bermanella marisrubri]EAT11971.1 Chemotaxis protein CheY (2 CheY domains) [Oceanobacter sp. RED65] [Bermanella marisrubri]QIZ84775.1 response regulator [Bermanella marisrubri]